MLHCVGIKEVSTSHCGVLFLMILLSVNRNVTMGTDSEFTTPILNLNLKLNSYSDWDKPLAQRATIKVPSKHMTYIK